MTDGVTADNFAADGALTESDQFLTIAVTRPSRQGPGHNVALGDPVFSMGVK
jgi:hypothetical protein